VVVALWAAVACSRDASWQQPASFGHAAAAVHSGGLISLVKDIDPTGSSSPASLTTVGGTVYFSAQTAEAGTELWRSDGTDANTVLVKDLNPGTGSSSPTALTPFGSQLAFLADDGTNGLSLWVTDGSDAGTLRLAAAAPLSLIAFVNGALYFVGRDATNGQELWITNGTAAGSKLIADINPGTGDSNIRSVAAMGSTLFFSATDGIHGQELWKTDGGTTTLVSDINSGANNSNPVSLLVAGTTLYFSADDGVHGVELWKTDGATTTLVSDINPAGSSSPANLVFVGGSLYFSADDGTHGRELWRSDASGTAIVLDINPGATGSNPSATIAPHGELIFTANDGTHGTELWASDGTATGTALVKDINPGVGDGFSDPARLFPLSEGVVLFAATDGSSGTELWQSDGSAAGTALVADLYAGSGSSNPSSLTRLGATVLLAATDGTVGQELWSVGVASLVVPTITCPSSYFVEATGPNGAAVTYSGATASNGLASLPVTFAPASGGTLRLTATSVTARTSNVLGGSAQCAFSVTVRDTTAPTIACPADVTAEATSPAGAKVTFAPATASDAVTPSPTITYSANSASTFPIATTVVTATATDLSGNSARCTFNVIVQDTTPPKLKCPPPGILEATNVGGAKIALYPPVITSDTASVPTVSYSPPTGSTLPLGTSFVVATSTDGAGNTAQCSFALTVEDTTPPKVICPGDQPVEATSAAGAVVNFPLATARDAVSTPQVSYSQDPGTAFPMGTTLVTVTATDASDNSAVCTFNVIVRDTTAPALTCPSNATDAVSTSPTVTYLPASNTAFALGDNIVTVTASDAAGNQSTCTFKVTVKDTTPPALTCPMNVTSEATSPQGAPVNYGAATATDAVTKSPTITYSQPAGSVFALGATNVSVLAKDAAGNTATCSFTVTVHDLTAPLIVCPADVRAQATSSAGTFLQLAPAQASDAASVPTISYRPSLNAPFPIGTTQVTATATDGSKNTATCTFNVIVQDTQAPSLLCPETVVAEASSALGATVTYGAVLAEDPVSTPTVTYAPLASGSLFPLGTTPVTATATDAAGNHLSCTFPVVVRDTTPPVVVCPASISAEATSPQGTPVTYGSATATDSVSAATVTYAPAASSLFPLGPTVVTATATDAAGNAATCTFIVTIKDTLAPTLACPPDLAAEATGPNGAVVTYKLPAATDAGITAPVVTADRASNALFPLGVTKVTLTAADDSGNAAHCAFNVTVRDTTAPALVCPGDVKVVAPNSTGTAVTFTLPTATDAVTPSPAVTADQTSGSNFAVGTTVVHVSSTDAAGNQGTCQFSIIVSQVAKTASGGCDTAAPAGWAVLVAGLLVVRRKRRA
jgi:ELWxxDGT repeat protein